MKVSVAGQGGAALAIIATGICGIIAAGGSPRSVQKPGIIRAERIELVDAEGKPRGGIASVEGGTALFVGSVPGAVLMATDDGVTLLLNGKNVRSHLVIETNKDDTVTIRIKERGGTERVVKL